MNSDEDINEEGPDNGKLESQKGEHDQSRTEDRESKTKQMEVHHHPDLHHKKKNWKEYFLEFLMIFLAVSMGFIAENIREHFGEREKEVEYIKSFIGNVEDDTAQLREVIQFNQKKIDGLDSFLLLSGSDFSDPVNRQRFYYFSNRHLFSEELFRSNDAVLAQLRNSGGYRFIQKDHIADSIASYDSRVKFIYEQGNYFDEAYKQARGLLDEIIDLRSIQDTSLNSRDASSKKPLLAFRSDQQMVRTFFNKLVQLRISIYSYCNSPYYLQGHLLYATRLVESLKKEYRLE